MFIYNSRFSSTWHLSPLLTLVVEYVDGLLVAIQHLGSVVEKVSIDPGIIINNILIDACPLNR
jgi:hypothetical protein